jgi:hypothetical protein
MFRMKQIEDTRTKMHSLMRGEIIHSGHNDELEARRHQERPGLPRALLAVAFDDPDALYMTPSDLVDKTRRAGFILTEKDADKLKRQQARYRRPRQRGDGDAPDAATWGNLIAKCESLRKENLQDFNEHTVYLIDYMCDVESNTLVAVVSSENFLLNAVRQTESGGPISLLADTAYRLTREKNGVYPLITANMAQATKIIAYGIISRENTDCQEFIFAVTKKEVERVVDHYIANNIAIRM